MEETKTFYPFYLIILSLNYDQRKNSYKKQTIALKLYYHQSGVTPPLTLELREILIPICVFFT